jgi:hypothetical protein
MDTIITSEKISEKLEKFLNRKPTKNEIENGKNSQHIIQEIILDKIEEQNKTILDLQNQLKAIKK